MGLFHKNIETEWKRFKRYCVNPEALPGDGSYCDFCKFIENHNYYPGHTHKFKLIYVGKDKDLMPVDHGIADLIEELNGKGYITKFCCSGHRRDFYRSGYIYFDKKSTSQEKMEKIKCVLGLKSDIIGFSMDFEGDIIRFRPKVNLLEAKITEEEYYRRLCETLREALWYESK